MKSTSPRSALWLLAAAFLLTGIGAAQRRPAAKRPVPPKPIVFAVINSAQDGKWIEPIALVDGGKLDASTNGDDDDLFSRNYYKAGAI